MRPARLAGALTILLLVGCASAPPPAGPDVAKLARYTAELDAAQTFYEVTIRDARREVDEGTITAAQFEAVIFSGRRMESALNNASAQLKVYQTDGVESAAFFEAFAEMKSAGDDLKLSWRAAHGR